MRKWMRFPRGIPWLLVCLLAVSAPAPSARAQEGDPASEPAGVLTLEQAVGLALENNRAIQNARIDAKRADIQVSAGKIDYLPRLSLSVTGAYLLSPLEFNVPQGLVDGKVPAQDTSFSMDTDFVAPIIAGLQQPLSDLYRIHLNVKALETGRDMVQEACREQRQDLIHGVQITYYSILTNQSELAAAEKDIAFYRSLLRVVEQRVKAHKALEVDVLDVSRELATAEHTRLSLRNSIEEGKERLNSLMGRDILTPVHVTEAPEIGLPAIDAQASGAQALDLRPEMRQAQLQLNKAKVEYRSEQLRDLPKLNFQILSISILNVPVIPEEVALLGVSMSWDFLDWGRPLKAIEEKKLAIRQATNTASQIESDILQDVNRTRRKVEEARSLIEVGEISERAGKAQLEIVKARYECDEAILEDVLDAQSKYEQARQTKRQAVLSYLVARADYLRAIGADSVQTAPESALDENSKAKGTP